MVENWCDDPYNTPNPFFEPEPGEYTVSAVVTNIYIYRFSDVSINDVRRELNNEESADLERGVMPLHATSASQLLVIMMELEEQQRVISSLRSQLKHGRFNTWSLSVDDKDAALRRKILLLQPIQKLYMPGLTPLLEADNGDDDAIHRASKYNCSSKIPLYFTSSFSNTTERTATCKEELIEKERHLRIAQAEDALYYLCKHLRIGSLIFDFKSEQTGGTGQKANTRMMSMIHRYNNLAFLDANRYRASCDALLELEPQGAWRARFLQLRDEHVRPLKRASGEGEGRWTPSWIWLKTSHTPVNSGPNVTGDAHHDKPDHIQSLDINDGKL